MYLAGHHQFMPCTVGLSRLNNNNRGECAQPGGKHGLLYDVTTTGTSGRSVGLSMLYRVLCCQNIGVVSSAFSFVAAEHKAAASPVGLSFCTTLPDSFDVLHCWGWCQTVLHFELQSLGLSILHDSGNVPTMDIGAIVKALRQHFGLHCHSWGGPNYWAVAYRCFCSSDLVSI